MLAGLGVLLLIVGLVVAIVWILWLGVVLIGAGIGALVMAKVLSE